MTRKKMGFVQNAGLCLTDFIKDEVSVKETIKLLTTDDEDTRDTDNTSSKFEINENLPAYYNEEKFKRGQQFYRKHLFAMLLSKLMGLIAILATPRIQKMFIFTNKSSDDMSSYKRYMACILYMSVWYEDDFKPDSKLWRSISVINNKHNFASDWSSKCGKGRIMQKDMSITQFGFMGIALVRSELVGIHYATKEEQEGFIHFWRVIGHILGVEERYNICRNSIEETKEICEALIEKVFVPKIKEQKPEFIKLSEALVNGMWVMVPLLDPKPFMTYLYFLLNQKLNNNDSKIPVLELNLYQKILYFLISLFTFHLKFRILRWYVNAQQILSYWFMRNFPFLAFYKYGFKNSYVSISIGRGKNISTN